MRSLSDLSHSLKAEAARSTAIDRSKLTVAESLGAFVVFAVWLMLFASGILVDTEPFRKVISPGGAALVASSLAPQDNANSNLQAPAGPPGGQAATSSQGPTLLESWAVVLLCFLPLNLAWICAASSTLGAFGEHANLARTQQHRRIHAISNPYASAVLRGFFVYLFLLSGLLLLDDTPFLHPNPGQYIRLAGFLSLFSFVVSYQPRLFNVLIVWAFHRIQAKEGEGESPEGGKDSSETHTLHLTRTAIEAEVRHTVHDSNRNIEAVQRGGDSVSTP